MSSPRDTDKPKSPVMTPPPGWPTKEIIQNHLFKLIPGAMATLPAVSTLWNESWKSFINNEQFWLDVLARDYGFDKTSLRSIEDANLRMIYMRMARLEETNPPYAQWFRKNIIETGCDFSLLYANAKVIDHLANAKTAFSPAWNNAFCDVITTLRVNNLALAKSMLDQLAQDPDGWFMKNLLKNITEFGNLDARIWLMDYCKASLATRNESKPAEEKPQDSTLLGLALQTPNRRFIEAELALAKPEEVLIICDEISMTAKSTRWPGLSRHAPAIVKALLAVAIKAIPPQTPLENMRQQLYPIAAFTGDIKTFQWLDAEMAQHHTAEPDFKPKPAANNTVMILCIAMRTGKIELMDWLVNPDGGKLNASLLTLQEFIPALQSDNPEMVVWLLEKPQQLHMTKTLMMMAQLAEYPAMTPLLEARLDKKTPRSQVIRLLFTAASHGNVKGVQRMLDNLGLVLTDTEKQALTTIALPSCSIPFLEMLVSPHRGQNQVRLTGDTLTAAIKLITSDKLVDENHLPALIHWLTDKNHGHLVVAKTDLDFIHHVLLTVGGFHLMTQNLVKEIAEHAAKAQATPKPL